MLNLKERGGTALGRKKINRRKKKSPLRILILFIVFLVLITITLKESGVFGTQQAPQQTERTTTTETQKAENLVDWRLILVNAQNPVPADLNIEFTNLRNDHKVDSRIYPELQKMFDDCRSAGFLPLIRESYRSYEEQKKIFDDKVSAYKYEGYDNETAYNKAAEYAALPGHSEHQLGLAVDITAENPTINNNEKIWRWLKDNCVEYGFIVRYPLGKEDITGIAFEPWHFRYVGKKAAMEITENGLCLEEYIKQKDIL